MPLKNYNSYGANKLHVSGYLTFNKYFKRPPCIPVYNGDRQIIYWRQKKIIFGDRINMYSYMYMHMRWV